MIKSVSIQIERGLAMNWVLNIDVVSTGFDNLSYDIEISEQTQSGTFKGPLASIVRMLPEALKAMGIAEAGSERAVEAKDAPEGDSKASDKSFNEAVNLHWAKKPEANQEPMGDDYALRQEESVKAIKHAIAQGPPDQTTK